jgi:hypothetical protein
MCLCVCVCVCVCAPSIAFNPASPPPPPTPPLLYHSIHEFTNGGNAHLVLLQQPMQLTQCADHRKAA